MRDFAERFWAKVQKTDGCWIWTANTPRGYGTVGRGDRIVRAHRAAYELLVGPIPEGLVLDHLCRNKACVNPAHLEAVTQGENVRRGNVVGRNTKTHCKWGHELVPENTYIDRKGTRTCKACHRASSTRYRRARYG